MREVEISNSRTLHRLIYASRISPGVQPMLDDQLSRIVATSVTNNAKVQITGLLLACGEWFLQALEGGAVTVMTTYGRILNDPRHTSPSILFSGPAEARVFGAWNMCGQRLNPSDEAILTTLRQKGEFDPSTMAPAAALRLLQTVGGIKARLEQAASAA